MQGRGLAPKDRNGFSDPVRTSIYPKTHLLLWQKFVDIAFKYVCLALGAYSFQSEVIPKTLDPTWNATFEIPLSGVSSISLSCECWDKDLIGKVQSIDCEICEMENLTLV